jgi:hypothetical protein
MTWVSERSESLTMSRGRVTMRAKESNITGEQAQAAQHAAQLRLCSTACACA